MIAIIGALDIEIDALKELLEQKQEVKKGNFSFFLGKIYGVNVVLNKCGVGKVYSAAATATLLSNFNVELIINTGIAGGVGNTTKKLDIVVAKRVVQHDFDLSAGIGYKKGQLSREHMGYFECAVDIADMIVSIASDVGTTHMGIIASGDKFIASKADATAIAEEFNALACDMESAAIGQVSAVFGVDFVSIRTISDNADGDAVEDFDVFKQRAAQKSIKIILDFLLKYKQI